MSASSDSSVRQCIFVFKDGAEFRKIKLPPEWQIAVVSSRGQLLSCLSQSRANRRTLLLCVTEEEFESEILELLPLLGADRSSDFGIVILSKDPISSFDKYSQMPGIVDVVPLKNFRELPQFLLAKSARLLVHSEYRSRVSQKTLETLNQIFINLSAEREPKRLLATILANAMELTDGVSGVLYLVREIDGELYFKLRIKKQQTNEVELQSIDYRVSENSVCGYVALTGRPLNFRSAQEHSAHAVFQFNATVDNATAETPAPVLTIPLKNSRNEIIAVLQLVDKNASSQTKIADRFDDDDESVISSFATQAAVCLETIDLYADIQKLFEGFVRASITAIESRDPSTGGHSERVAKMTVALAREISDCDIGIYRSVKFKEEEMRELEYAALLHDFGKIGVREEVLVKAKKLYSQQLDAIKERVKIFKAAAKISYLEEKLRKGTEDLRIERNYQHKVQEIESYWQIVQLANEPTVLHEQNFQALEHFQSEQFLLPDGTYMRLLTDEEYYALSVPQGSLTDNERLEIESHVRHTYQFLKMIPWTKDFRHLPEIAFCHHEKLDGSGYPRGLFSQEIPLQSKIMTVADIYDALTAADRWYKEAVAPERALEILAQEVAEGKLDPILFELFVEKKIYELIQPKLFKKGVGS